jgi:Fic family protein
MRAKSKFSTGYLMDLRANLTSSKWAKLIKCSQDTASRDIDDLFRRGLLVKDAAGGRSTSYSLVEKVQAGT